jgi:hypothetical protein
LVAAVGNAVEEPPFSIDPISGLITTVRSLDREQRDTYQLIGIAEQIGSASAATDSTATVVTGMSSNVSVVIQVSYNVAWSQSHQTIL